MGGSAHWALVFFRDLGFWPLGILAFSGVAKTQRGRSSYFGCCTLSKLRRAVRWPTIGGAQVSVCAVCPELEGPQNRKTPVQAQASAASFVSQS